MRSLRTRIVTLVLVALAAVLLPLVMLSYVFVINEVDELSDARLAQNARTISALAASSQADMSGALPISIAAWRSAHEKEPLTVRGHSYETQIGFQFWSSDNALAMASENFLSVTLDAAPSGFADIDIGKRHWRVFTLLGEGGHWVRVGERYDSRREIARALAIEAIAPALISLPLLAFLVGAAVHRGVRPLRRLAEQLAARSPDDTNPLGGDLPAEIVAVVAALNGLLLRVRKLLDHEREFIANAAHELRTPLAGALMRVENARAALGTDAARVALDDAHAALDRLGRLVGQLLDLAYWDAGQAQPIARVDLGACVGAGLDELSSAIGHKDLELRVQSPAQPVYVDGWEPGLRTLVRNLLDNAIRHSPEHGRIDLFTGYEDAAVVLRVADQGPGIAPSARAQVFQRFHRGARAMGEGSGIGLSLVARIAELHRARIELGEGDDGAGLRVDVRFPPAKD